MMAYRGKNAGKPYANEKGKPQAYLDLTQCKLKIGFLP